MKLGDIDYRPGLSSETWRLSILGLYWDNGKENGNYYSILGLFLDITESFQKGGTPDVPQYMIAVIGYH